MAPSKRQRDEESSDDSLSGDDSSPSTDSHDDTTNAVIAKAREKLTHSSKPGAGAVSTLLERSKTRIKDALGETKRGLKKISRTKATSKSKKAGSKGKAAGKAAKKSLITVGAVMLIHEGIDLADEADEDDDEGLLFNPIPCDNWKDILVRGIHQGLSVDSARAAQLGVELVVDLDWSHERFQGWLRELFPEAFAVMDATQAKLDKEDDRTAGLSRWVLCTKTSGHRSVFEVVEVEFPSGEHLSSLFFQQRNPTERLLVFATREAYSTKEIAPSWWASKHAAREAIQSSKGKGKTKVKTALSDVVTDDDERFIESHPTPTSFMKTRSGALIGPVINTPEHISSAYSDAGSSIVEFVEVSRPASPVAGPSGAGSEPYVPDYDSVPNPWAVEEEFNFALPS